MTHRHHGHQPSVPFAEPHGQLGEALAAAADPAKTGGHETGWVLVPPLYVLFAHGLLLASLLAVANWVALVVQGTLEGWATAARRAAATAANPRTTTTEDAMEQVPLNESFLVTLPAAAAAGGRSSPHGSADGVDAPATGGTASRRKAPKPAMTTVVPKVTPLGACHLALRSNFAVDMACVLKMTAVLTFLVYAVDIEGGWDRYNIIGLAVICAGHMNVAAAYAARLTLDPAPVRGDDSILHKLVRVVVPTWLRRAAEPAKPAPVAAGSSSAAKQKLAAGSAKPGTAGAGGPKRGVVTAIAALDVRVLQVIGAEIDQVTYRAFVFTLYGCTAPLLVTHFLPACVAFAPYLLALCILVVAVIRIARRMIAFGLRRSPSVALVATVCASALVQAALLWLLQAGVVLAGIMYSEGGGLRGLSKGMLIDVALQEWHARMMPPATLGGILGRGGLFSVVPFVGQLII